MMDQRDILNVLVEIRDLQRQQVEEYRRVTQESLELQRQAVKRQEQIGKLYQRVVLLTLPLIGVLVFLLIYLLGGFR